MTELLQPEQYRVFSVRGILYFPLAEGFTLQALENIYCALDHASANIPTHENVKELRQHSRQLYLTYAFRLAAFSRVIG